MDAGEKKRGPWINRAIFSRLGRYVPGGGVALEGSRMEEGKKLSKKARRCGVVFPSTAGMASAAARYPEQRADWGIFLDVVRLVSRCCDCLTNEEENYVACRVQAQLKLDGRLDGLRDLCDISRKELRYLYSLVDDALTNFHKVRTEVGFRACEDTQLEVLRYGDLCKDLMREVAEIEKAVEEGGGDQSSEVRLVKALKELGKAKQGKRQAQEKADQTRDDLKALVMRQQGLV